MSSHPPGTRVVLYAYSARTGAAEHQLHEMEAFAAHRGWSVVARYSDAGVKPSTGVRLQLQRMIEGALGGECEVLLINDLSRLSRDPKELCRLVGQISRAGVQMCTVADGRESAPISADYSITLPRGRLTPALVRRIHDELQAGRSVEEVAAGLNGEGVSAP